MAVSKENYSNSGGAHLPRLDSVRALAILSVFLLHSLGAAFSKDQLDFRGGWLNFHSAPSRVFLAFYPLTFGWVGVSLFFVLSGFVIHYSFLVASRSFSASRFFVRRFWRIYPPYLLALTVFALRARLYGARIDRDFALHLALVHNLFAPNFFGQINGSFWSIAAEVQFYLAYPLVLSLRRRIGMANVVKVALGLAIAGLAVVMLRGGIPPWQEDFNRQLPTNTWFDWVLGAFVAERFFEDKRWVVNAKPVLAALGVAFFLSTLRWEMATFSFLLFSIFCAVALECCVWSVRPLGRMETMLVPVGLCSYSLYLWHQPLIVIALNFARRLGVHSPPVLFLIAILMFFPICAFSWVMYRSVEKPVNDLGRALLRGRIRSHLIPAAHIGIFLMLALFGALRD